MGFKSSLAALSTLMVLSGPAFAERGADGELRIIYWQAPTTLNPYLSSGSKDIEAAALTLEPLARYDADGAVVAWLADEVPTLENGGVSDDLMSITWTLKEGLIWSDGSAVTSEDVKFTYDYCTHPDAGCAHITKFQSVSTVEVTGPRSVIVTFKTPQPNPYVPFVGGENAILQKAQFGACLGAAAPTCTAENFGPIGTGPFVVEEFRPGDVMTMVANDNYREADKPAFATVMFKGGGDAFSAAQAILKTGEFDYGMNLQLAPDVMAGLAEGGIGKPIAGFGPLLERIMLNHTNPDPALGPDERAVVRPHPFLQEPAVFKAMSMAIDRPALVAQGYGPSGKVTCNWLAAPPAVDSDTFACDTQDIAGANALLDKAGIVDSDGDGIREKAGTPLRILFQTSNSAVRQDFQALIKSWWREIGIETELRDIPASVYFGSDLSSPDSMVKFYADVEMYASDFSGTDPQSYLARALCDKAPTPDNQWQGENVSRFCMPEYDALFETLTQTADPAKRAQIAKKLNDMAVENGMLIPLVHRGRQSAHALSLGGVNLNVWDTELWNAADWYRID